MDKRAQTIVVIFCISESKCGLTLQEAFETTAQISEELKKKTEFDGVFANLIDVIDRFSSFLC